MDKNTILISAAVAFKDFPNGEKYFVVKQPETNDWEIVKVIVRKGESSVRAILRIMAERAGLSTRILDEVGRSKSTVSNGKKMSTQLCLYYLLLVKTGSKEPIGFNEYLWLDYQKAIKKVASKKDAAMIKDAREMIKLWKKKRLSKKLLKP
jgi:hypothetical protein